MLRLRKTRKILNLASTLSRVEGDSPLLAELAAIFLQDYPCLLNEIRDSVARRDHARLERAAHTLKGRLAFFTIDEMRKLALRLETMGREHDWKGAQQILYLIESKMVYVLQEFEVFAREHRT